MAFHARYGINKVCTLLFNLFKYILVEKFVRPLKKRKPEIIKKQGTQQAHTLAEMKWATSMPSDEMTSWGYELIISECISTTPNIRRNLMLSRPMILVFTLKKGIIFVVGIYILITIISRILFLDS